ncbi:hypothetical protein ABEB36_014469 [Hypothenemus hampei]|uniref:DUF4817 domain-containing protein n=1 Tax=Hypothenemus hampei TaxID=57062 RepID=A0ABD1E263_HYPHA
MKTYSKEHRIDMIFILGECDQNCLLASQVYAQKFPERSHPNKAVFERLLRQFKDTGSVNYKKPLKQKSVTGNEENEFEVVGSVVDNPNISQREISHNTNISLTSICRILKKHK